jgi:hypothetical protein
MQIFEMGEIQGDLWEIHEDLWKIQRDAGWEIQKRYMEYSEKPGMGSPKEVGNTGRSVMGSPWQLQGGGYIETWGRYSEIWGGRFREIEEDARKIR